MNMILFFSLIIILIGFFTFMLVKSKNMSFSKNIVITFICTIFILNIVLNPKVSLNSA